jgi:hypothetical protein
MIKSSLLQSSKSTSTYSSNESIALNKLTQFGQNTYEWNARFISLFNAFLLGTQLQSLTQNTLDPLSKFVAFANGTLPTTDLDYDMISQYNDYLATL